jgi:hypothetical protein
MGLGLDWRRRREQLRLLPFVRVSVVAVARGGTCRSVSVWPLGIFLGGGAFNLIYYWRRAAGSRSGRMDPNFLAGARGLRRNPPPGAVYWRYSFLSRITGYSMGV